MRRTPPYFLRLLCFSALLSGCALGPDFLRPEPPAAARYTATPLPEKTEEAPGALGAAQRFVSEQDIPADWWTLFHSDALDNLIREALAGSPGIAAAEARLRQGQENLKAEKGASLFPQIDLDGSAERKKLSAAAIGAPLAFPPTIFNLYNASVDVSYNLDIFGAARRETEALGAEAEYQEYELKAARLTLSSNLATSAFKEASLRAQLEALQEIISAQEDQLAVMEKQLLLGGTAQMDVIARRREVEQTKALLPPLETALEQTRNQLAVYVGKLPGEANLPEFHLETFALPQDVPVSLPSVLVRQRPDILAAEARLHKASAEIGVATANLFPQFRLSASYGPLATETGAFFNKDSLLWSLGASLTQPVFHGGELLAKRRAATAAYDEAAADYRQVVLQGFQNVADSLKALEADARELKSRENAAAQAKAAWGIAKRQFALGGISHLALLDTQRQYQQTRLDLAQAQAARLADTAALFQALGGGWWNCASLCPGNSP